MQPFQLTSGEIELYRQDDGTVDLVFYHLTEQGFLVPENEVAPEVLPSLTREDLTRLGGKLIRHGTHAVTQIPVSWANNIPIEPEDRVRIAMLRLLGCTCELPLLGYTGGKATDGPRCRLCNTGVIFESEEQ